VPSSAFTVHLQQLLRDAEELDRAHARLRTGNPGRQYGLASLNRATVVMTVSAWESYIEELMRECLGVLRPVAPPLDPWPALNAYILGLLGRFHTPNAVNVTNLINNSLGLADVRPSWSWQNCTPLQAEQRLDQALTYRHEIAHGVNPRPNILNFYSSQLPDFFRRLARCTDAAVRLHLVNIQGVVNPWPP
jgi:RiboL-PSP-HEPN